MMVIWERSGTYTHGFLVFPISAYLIWRVRKQITAQSWGVNPYALPVLALLVFTWVVANVSDIVVVEQAAWVAMIPVLVWLVLGSKVTFEIIFPLAFLVFAVPFGEDLVDPLIEFTAVFSVHALRLTGIPVYWEGNLLSLPSGNWAVVEACSGVRYLIASLTLGTLYAYLTYRSLWRRLVFMVLSLVVPIFANGLRAYLIMIIGHVSDMKYAVGVDHLIYGWVFFGLVMLLLFWIGNFWREDEPSRSVVASDREPGFGSTGDSAIRLTVVAALAALLIIGGPLWASQVLSRSGPTSVVLSAPSGQAGWNRVSESVSAWQPTYVNATAELRADYQGGSEQVGLFVAFYAQESRESELISSHNTLVTSEGPWRLIGSGTPAVRFGDESGHVREVRLRSAAGDLLVWQYFDVDDVRTASRYEAKLRGAFARLIGNTNGAAVVLFTPIAEGPEAAERGRASLQSFLTDMLPAVRTTLTSARAAAIELGDG
jgi:exosortase A